MKTSKRMSNPPSLPFSQIPWWIPAAAFLLLILNAPCGIATTSPQLNLTQYVNTFVGTENGGNTFPGALWPTGLIQWSPDTDNTPGNYLYTSTSIKGFSLTHFSGRGIKYLADIPFTPYVGPVTQSPGTNVNAFRSTFSHAHETAQPGYYSVSLDNGVKVELTTTLRTGAGRFTFPASTNSTLIINTGGSANGDTGNTGITITGSNQITGHATTTVGSDGPKNLTYTVYFVAEFDRPFSSSGTWNGSTLTRGSTSSTGSQSGAFLVFDTTTNAVVNVRTSISYVSVANAEANLAAENPTFYFSGNQAAANQAWNTILNKVQASGGTIAQLQTFYTMLYLSFIHPNILDDANGEYMGMDEAVHQLPAGHHQYQNISGWDMYRSLVPLRALLTPQETSDLMQSLVNWASQGGGGALPRWEQVDRNSNGMEGDGQSIILTSGYAFGATDFDTAGAENYMQNDLSVEGASCDGQQPESEISSYLSLGYWPASASQTLELSEADFALSQFAEHIGDLATEKKYRLLSGDWQNTFNTASGFPEPRNADGTWEADFNPLSDTGFREGDAYQYTWLVPYDVAGLATALGGNANTISRLNSFFTKLDASETSTYANMGNEPGEEVPWEYDFVGDPAATQSVVRNIQQQLFTPSPGGLPGNNDGGAISSWYVFSAMGLYPEIPGVGGMVVGSPVFPGMFINLENGKQISIVGTNAAAANPYVQSMTLNGASWSHLWIPFETLNAGATLGFVLGDAPSTWGAAPADAPPSYGPNSYQQKFEAESLAILAYSAPDYRIVSDPRYSGGKAVLLDANAVGNDITFTVPNIAAGKYDVTVGVKKDTTRSIWQLSVSSAGQSSGTNVGAPQDEYAASPVFTGYDLGTWTPVSTSDKWFTFTITGKDANSKGYSMAIDSITLTPQP
jgi:predicted alpha-1,2-mannosidase